MTEEANKTEQKPSRRTVTREEMIAAFTTALDQIPLGDNTGFMACIGNGKSSVVALCCNSRHMLDFAIALAQHDNFGPMMGPATTLANAAAEKLGLSIEGDAIFGKAGGGKP